MKELQSIVCRLKDYTEVARLIHSHGGATNETYSFHDKAIIIAQISDELKLFLLLKYPDITIEKR